MRQTGLPPVRRSALRLGQKGLGGSTPHLEQKCSGGVTDWDPARHLLEQKIYNVFCLNASIGGDITFIHGQYYFLVIVWYVLKRHQLTLTCFYASYGLSDLHVHHVLWFFCNKVYFLSTEYPDRYAVATAQKLKVNYVLQDMTTIRVAITEQHVSQSRINNVVLAERLQILLTLDVITRSEE